MDTVFTRRNMIKTTAVIGAAAIVGCATGCASSNIPTTNPVGPTNDQQAYDNAMLLITPAEATLDALIADGYLVGKTASDAKAAELAVNSAMAAWKAGLNTTSSAELEAAVLAVIPALLLILANGTATKAAVKNTLLRSH